VRGRKSPERIKLGVGLVEPHLGRSAVKQQPRLPVFGETQSHSPYGMRSSRSSPKESQRESHSRPDVIRRRHGAVTSLGGIVSGLGPEAGAGS
jgi:hypothetical protein